MTLLPGLAQIAAPLLQHEPRHRWAARTNQLNLTWEKDGFGKGSRHRVMPQPSRLERSGFAALEGAEVAPLAVQLDARLVLAGQGVAHARRQPRAPFARPRAAGAARQHGQRAAGPATSHMHLSQHPLGIRSVANLKPQVCARTECTYEIAKPKKRLWRNC